MDWINWKKKLVVKLKVSSVAMDRCEEQKHRFINMEQKEHSRKMEQKTQNNSNGKIHTQKQQLSELNEGTRKTKIKERKKELCEFACV